MKVLLIFIISFNFSDFYNASVYKKYSQDLQELTGYQSDILTLLPFFPEISYESYKVENTAWAGYYRIDVPLFSIQYFYLPFLLNANSNLLKFTKATNRYKTMATMFNEYIDLWYFSMLMKITDSLIKIKKRIVETKMHSENEFDVLKEEKELLNLIDIRDEYRNSYLDLMHKHQIKFNDFPEESPESILEISSEIRDSLLVYKKVSLRFKNNYVKKETIYLLLGFLPEMSYIYLRQFMNFDPLNPFSDKEIKAFSIGIRVSPIELLSLYKSKKREIERSELEYKMLMLKSHRNKENLEPTRRKIEFLGKIDSFYQRQIEMWKRGNIGFGELAEYSQFYLETLRETIEDVYKRSRINEE